MDVVDCWLAQLQLLKGAMDDVELGATTTAWLHGASLADGHEHVSCPSPKAHKC